MTGHELLLLFGNMAMLSLMSIGGAIAVAPEMHRIVVVEHGWLDSGQFAASISLAQASPGPNVLFVTLVGWNAAGWRGALATTLGILLPSSILAVTVNRWATRLSDRRWMRALRGGLAPITIGLLLATGWILAAHNAAFPPLLAIAAATALIVTATRVNPLLLMVAGACAGLYLTSR